MAAESPTTEERKEDHPAFQLICPFGRCSAEANEECHVPATTRRRGKGKGYSYIACTHGFCEWWDNGKKACRMAHLPLGTPERGTPEYMLVRSKPTEDFPKACPVMAAPNGAVMSNQVGCVEHQCACFNYIAGRCGIPG